jgi:hypothetical protein
MPEGSEYSPISALLAEVQKVKSSDSELVFNILNYLQNHGSSLRGQHVNVSFVDFVIFTEEYDNKVFFRNFLKEEDQEKPTLMGGCVHLKKNPPFQCQIQEFREEEVSRFVDAIEAGNASIPEEKRKKLKEQIIKAVQPTFIEIILHELTHVIDRCLQPEQDGATSLTAKTHASAQGAIRIWEDVLGGKEKKSIIVKKLVCFMLDMPQEYSNGHTITAEEFSSEIITFSQELFKAEGGKNKFDRKFQDIKEKLGTDADVLLSVCLNLVSRSIDGFMFKLKTSELATKISFTIMIETANNFIKLVDNARQSLNKTDKDTDTITIEASAVDDIIQQYSTPSSSPSSARSKSSDRDKDTGVETATP